ncbi:MAG TPA: hypothetical protein VK174_05515, partial [Chitinophagales bacterium]|nr:hypothetical protein [Chitinophagales bacterium]
MRIQLAVINHQTATKCRGIFLALSCLLLIVVDSNAQSALQLTKAGDKKVEEGDYYAASRYYNDAIKKDDENAELHYKYAEASRMFNDLVGATAGYRAVLKLDKSNKYP